jgi:hypothetical protein
MGAAQFNGRTAEVFATAFSEWQHFVSHRLTQDMQLLQRLARCTSPDQVAWAYADFWQKAFADYAKEFKQLLNGVADKAITNARSAPEEAAKSTPRTYAAA